MAPLTMMRVVRISFSRRGTTPRRASGGRNAMPLGVMISLHQGLLLIPQSATMLQPVHMSQPHFPVDLVPGPRLNLLARSLTCHQQPPCCGLTTAQCSACAQQTGRSCTLQSADLKAGCPSA